MGQDVERIENDLFGTFFHNWFFDCKTWEFVSRNEKSRKRFVECVERTDDVNNIAFVDHYKDLSLVNAVRKLLKHGEMEFFFEVAEQGVTPIWLDNQVYYVKAEDVTKEWPNHHWLRTRRPFLGFKAVRSDGGSVMFMPKDSAWRCKVGEDYIIDEDDILNGDRSPVFFSLYYEKAHSYLKNKGDKLYLVAASGLMLIKNSWDDIGASSLQVLKELSLDEMDRIEKNTNEPRIFWSGDRWDSYDQELSDKLWGNEM